MSDRSLVLPQDYVDLLLALNDAQADFLIVGGWAVAAHGHGRATDDLDILVRPSVENAARVYSALDAFGAPLGAHGVDAGLFATARYGYRIGRKPLLIELLTTIDGVSYDEAARDALVVSVDGTSVRVIGRRALVANKRAAGRPKDIADVESLLSLDETE